ncbi:ABC transporter permease [Rhizohabitans arisaemae]|uniref:ABC transporter permease n=1 Tax=Rhizohabitans arisaemae TaxID=2720610 RepID=UPI0024B15688|nr:ABC transporter permease subunit [Rhizohabitans arisaemae]
MPTLVRKTLRDYRRSLIGWTVGICAFLTLYLSIYPSIAANPDVYGDAALAKYPGALRDLMGGLDDIASGAGYLQTLVYQLFGPLLFIVCAVLLANRAIAVPEGKGTLELTLALPLSRSRIVLERWAAVAVGLLIVTVVSFALVTTMVALVDMNVEVDRVLAAHTGLYLLALLVGTLALAIGAITGRKAVALAASGGVAVASYAIESLAKNVDAISWLRWVSPFRYYADGNPLRLGWPVGDYLILAAAIAVLLFTAVRAFDRRDVGV